MDSFKLETNFKDLNLGKHFAAAKGALKDFKEKVEEFRGLNKDGLLIHEYFSQLRNQIDIERGWGASFTQLKSFIFSLAESVVSAQLMESEGTEVDFKATFYI